MNEQFVVVSDIHGQAELLERVINRYGDDVSYILNGDMIDRGPDSRGIFDIAADIGANIILGNHEWVLLGAMNDPNPERRAAWQETWFGIGSMRYENQALQSYGIGSRLSPEEAASELKETMLRLGHLSLLENAKIYNETPGVLVVHSGLPSDIRMERIHERLDSYLVMHQANQYVDEPEELFSAKLATSYKAPRDLSKLLVTGHIHYRRPLSERLYGGTSIKPTRAYLASCLDLGDPLYVYESWSGQIAAFEQP